MIAGIYGHKSCMFIRNAIPSLSYTPISHTCNSSKRVSPRGVPFKSECFLTTVNHLHDPLQHQQVPPSGRDSYAETDKQPQPVLWTYGVWRMKDKHPLGPQGLSCEWPWYSTGSQTIDHQGMERCKLTVQTVFVDFVWRMYDVSSLIYLPNSLRVFCSTKEFADSY